VLPVLYQLASSSVSIPAVPLALWIPTDGGLGECWGVAINNELEQFVDAHGLELSVKENVEEFLVVNSHEDKYPDGEENKPQSLYFRTSCSERQ
jgi:hypothetical protein